MPAVFIHGVPDTYRVWEPVIEHLHQVDTVALALPGFDSPLPEGFKATKEEYVDWIIGQLEQQSGPVDLVGHDWGCIFVARVASVRPDLIRTWAAGGGPVSKDYEWHPLAKIWQMQGAGEQFMTNLKASEFSGQLEQLGVPANLAKQATDLVDDRMKDCILRLYRSALNVGREWQSDLKKIKAPGLVLWGALDEACPVRFADELAQDSGATRVLKLETGHWFPLQAPAETARALEEHWRSVAQGSILSPSYSTQTES